MKLHFSALFVFASSLLGTSLALAGDYTLHGHDANNFANILISNGLSVQNNNNSISIAAYDVFCMGRDYQNTCMFSTDQMQAAATRLFIYDHHVAENMWILLKKAGLQSFISNNSDGSGGQTILPGGMVNCFNINTHEASCTIDGIR